MTEWHEVPLGEVIELKRGYDLPKRARADGPFPIVSSSGISGNHAEAKVRGPGVVTGRYGTLGQVFYVTSDFWPLNTALYVRDFKGNNERFVALLLESMDLAQHDGAAAVPGLNRNQLHTLPVRVPDRAGQDKIALVVESIDDLIENNRRRVTVLEEMARAIYREWFVHFRYPGHENVPLVDSPLGPIPDGWSVVPLVDAAEITMGQSPKSEFYNSDGEGKPFHQGVADFGAHYPNHRKYCTVEPRLALAEDVLVSVRAPVGRINVADTTLVIGRGLAAIRSRNDRQGVLRGALEETFSEEDSMGSGTIFNAIGKRELEQLPIVLPTDAIAARGDEVLGTLFGEIRSLTFASRRLSSLRDLLLPKLVTGQVDVSRLDLDELVEVVSA